MAQAFLLNCSNLAHSKASLPDESQGVDPTGTQIQENHRI